MNLTILNLNTPTMPLKEITDLLRVDHSKAMKKVTDTAQDIDFGSVAKMEIAYNLAGQTTETYLLNKRQSIAVASRLNTALLMKIIDRWQELEEAQQKALPQTHIEAVRAYLITLETVEAQEKRLGIQQKVIDHKNIQTDCSVTHFTIKRIRALNQGMKIDPKILLRVCGTLDNGVETVYDHYDQSINQYSRDVWEEAYPDAILPD